jgi:23S rRNA (cytidine2498-2'-O)-methyltransferase
MARFRPTGLTGYLAATGYVDELRAELGAVTRELGRLLLAPGAPRPAAWAQNVWHDPVTIEFDSIAAGARALRSLQRGWALLPGREPRRAALLEEQLPHVAARPLCFPDPPPATPLGSWTLLDRTTILAAPRCSAPVPHGEMRFVENHVDPPGRAYLKLWELCTRLGHRPRRGDRCVDLGASPGSWTWVLAELGARVLAVDRAPLADRVARRPGVEVRLQDAFALDPAAVGVVDWLLSDLACYPERLLPLVRAWQETAGTIVCTVKLQERRASPVLAELAAIPGAQLVHLHHNRHELTWVWRRPPTGGAAGPSGPPAAPR